jgi:molybdopterin/thiamine biosynthesis adenylyltransferase
MVGYRERVKAARYLVLGAGALGNEVIKDLVLAGARDVTLVDMDHVVRSNLNRCVMFRERDSADRRWKAEVVAERAADLDPEVRMRAVVGKIEELDDREWNEHDVCLGCLDNIAARLHANAHSYYCGTPYIDGGIRRPRRSGAGDIAALDALPPVRPQQEPLCGDGEAALLHWLRRSPIIEPTISPPR